jgi:uncharacterized protein YdaU (DUF1376 family)
MKADIWYPRYVGDYHRDTMHLSTLQHGAYCLLIDAYWINQGPLPDNDQQFANITKMSLSDWSAIRSVISKFFTQEGSELSKCPVWRHKRVEIEIEKARKQKDAKSLAAKNTNLKRWGNVSHSDSHSDSLTVSHEGRSSPSPSPSTMLTHSADRPGLEEVFVYADRIGLAKWKAEDWFNEMEGCGWLDYNHRPVIRWQALLSRTQTKWVSDGRPSGPPASKNGQPKLPEPKQIQEVINVRSL